jgi:hypothetical protein
MDICQALTVVAQRIARYEAVVRDEERRVAVPTPAGTGRVINKANERE